VTCVTSQQVSSGQAAESPGSGGVRSRALVAEPRRWPGQGPQSLCWCRNHSIICIGGNVGAFGTVPGGLGSAVCGAAGAPVVTTLGSPRSDLRCWRGILSSASRRGLAPSPTCHSAASWSPRKWDVAVDDGNIAESRQPSSRGEGYLVISDITRRSRFTRRSFILAASASVICAPPIVRAASLMPVRAVGPVGPQYYGLCERTFIHGLTPHLSELSRAGASAYGVAAELNGRKVSAVNGVPGSRHIPRDCGTRHGRRKPDPDLARNS
jgi:hypothetical protein